MSESHDERVGEELTPGQHLKALRSAAGKSQRAAGAVVDVTHTTISNWEKDVGRPTRHELEHLATFYDADVDELLAAFDYTSTGAQERLRLIEERQARQETTLRSLLEEMQVLNALLRRGRR